MMILSKWRCQYLWPLWPVNLLCTKWDSHQDALNPLTGAASPAASIFPVRICSRRSGGSNQLKPGKHRSALVYFEGAAWLNLAHCKRNRFEVWTQRICRKGTKVFLAAWLNFNRLVFFCTAQSLLSGNAARFPRSKLWKRLPICADHC